MTEVQKEFTRARTRAQNKLLDRLVPHGVPSMKENQEYELFVPILQDALARTIYNPSLDSVNADPLYRKWFQPILDFTADVLEQKYLMALACRRMAEATGYRHILAYKRSIL